MPVYWSKQHKRWRFEFDRYIQGERRRTGKLLPKGWSQAEADAFDRTEGARLYAVAAGVIDDNPLIETAVVMYLTDKEGLKSFKTAREHLLAVAPAYAGKRMADLADVAAEINRKRARSDGKGALADATVKQRIALLKAACRWGWKQHGLTRHDPTARMRLPTVKNERHVYLTRAEMLTACRACVNHGTRIAARVAFYSGMRLGEVMRAYPDGDSLILEDTKNGDRRVIPAHPKIHHLLPFLPLDVPKITLQRAWSRALKVVGLAGVTFHDLRHSAASEMRQAGVAIETVGDILGHRDTRSTKRYAHLGNEAARDAINSIGRRKVG